MVGINLDFWFSQFTSTKIFFKSLYILVKYFSSLVKKKNDKMHLHSQECSEVKMMSIFACVKSCGIYYQVYIPFQIVTDTSEWLEFSFWINSTTGLFLTSSNKIKTYPTHSLKFGYKLNFLFRNASCLWQELFITNKKYLNIWKAKMKPFQKTRKIWIAAYICI